MAVVDDLAHEVLGAVFGRSELLGDVPETIGPSFDVEFLEDVARAINVDIPALMICGETHIHIWIVSFLQRSVLTVIPSDLCYRLWLPAAPVADAGAKDVGNAPKGVIDFLAVWGGIYVSVVRPVVRNHILSPDDKLLNLPLVEVLDVWAHTGRIDHVLQLVGVPGNQELRRNLTLCEWQ